MNANETLALASLDGFPVPDPQHVTPLNWPVNADDAEHMRIRQAQNRAVCTSNPHENAVWERLRGTGRKWSRQAQWGYRLFDFWCHEIGVAIEVDGPEHDEDRDGHRDRYQLGRSAIVVLRVRNGDDRAIDHVVRLVTEAQELWSERRERFGLRCNTWKGRRRLVRPPDAQQSMF